MSWITDNKGQGPWTAPTTNRKEGGYVNNPRWKNPVTGEILATSPVWNPDQRRVPVISGSRHNPCGYWFRGPAPTTPSVYPVYDFYVMGWNTTGMGVTGIVTLDDYLTSIADGYVGIDAGSLSLLATIIQAFHDFETAYAAGYWKSIASRNWNMLCVRSDGTLWAWGINGDGQLGTGDKVAVLTLTQIGVATNWESCSVGDRDAFAINEDGDLWACGVNTDGHLGTGDSVDLLTFTQVATDVVSVASMVDYETFIVKTDGTLWTADAVVGPSFTQVDAGPWAAVSSASAYALPAGGQTRLLLKTDGTLWGYGNNDYGALGQGNTTPLGSITQIGSDSDWASVCGMNTYTLAIKESGALYGCGAYTSGGGGIYHIPEIGLTLTLLGTGYALSTSLFAAYVGSGILDIAMLYKI